MDSFKYLGIFTEENEKLNQRPASVEKVDSLVLIDEHNEIGMVVQRRIQGKIKDYIIK